VPLFDLLSKLWRGTQVYARGGLLLNGIVAGDNMVIRKMLIRMSNLPMLAAVVQSWKGKNRKGAPLHLDRLRIQGMQVHNLRGSSLKYLHQMFAEFPSTLSIHHLELVHTELVRYDCPHSLPSLPPRAQGNAKLIRAL